ncbi:MAG TPA: HIT family protein [Candidatus Woesebacteria bacterium]|nr:HIT family protein [Candidatus Woesebacteria bacterium]
MTNSLTANHPIPSCIFCTPQNLHLIRQEGNWYIALNRKQTFLGRTMLVYQQHIQEVSALPSQEWLKLHSLITRTQQAICKAFQPDKFDISILGNEIAHLHVHIVPRYQSARIVQGHSFTDNFWGSNYGRYNGVSPALEPSLMHHILTSIQSHL